MEENTAKNAEQLEEVKLDQDVQDAAVDAEPEAETGEATFADELNGVVENFEADIDKAMEPEQVLSSTTISEIADMLESLSKRLGSVEELLGAVAKKEDIDDLRERLDTEVTAIKDGVKDSFKNLTTSITKRVAGLAIESLTEASAVEIEATTQVVTDGTHKVGFTPAGIPKGMPGSN